ncbi:PfkB domain-containing protein [Aphelenchoides besseyi]|nr:PfkB domain-containing protein [Aphelenchoides besseyi]KAI6195278.1 PfkB domain-containing protein [Aphelenchoides besseyi]
MGKILVVGLTCVDLISFVQKYPDEDSDARVFDQKTSLGGNAANSLVVLTQIEKQCNVPVESSELFSSVPLENALLDDLIKKTGIKLRRVNRSKATLPISTVIVNELTGTRTILHFRGNLPELTVDEFVAEFPSLSEFSWIHFEGRNFDEVLRMIEYCREKRDPTKTKLSVEFEKVRPFPWYEKMAPLVDVLFVSKDFAKHLGFLTMETAVVGLQERFQLTNTTVIVPWGELGVAARVGQDSQLLIQSSFPPERIQDTLAAGDTFIAAALHGLNSQRPLTEVLRFACMLAGRKCGQRGLMDLDLNGLDL